MYVEKVQTGIRLPRPMYGKLKHIAVDENRTVNNFVELILKRYLVEYERQHGEVPTDH